MSSYDPPGLSASSYSVTEGGSIFFHLRTLDVALGTTYDFSIGGDVDYLDGPGPDREQKTFDTTGTMVIEDGTEFGGPGGGALRSRETRQTRRAGRRRRRRGGSRRGPRRRQGLRPTRADGGLPRGTARHVTACSMA